MSLTGSIINNLESFRLLSLTVLISTSDSSESNMYDDTTNTLVVSFLDVCTICYKARYVFLLLHNMQKLHHNDIIPCEAKISTLFFRFWNFHLFLIFRTKCAKSGILFPKLF